MVAIGYFVTLVAISDLVATIAIGYLIAVVAIGYFVTLVAISDLIATIAIGYLIAVVAIGYFVTLVAIYYLVATIAIGYLLAVVAIGYLIAVVAIGFSCSLTLLAFSYDGHCNDNCRADADNTCQHHENNQYGFHKTHLSNSYFLLRLSVLRTHAYLKTLQL